MVEYLAQQLTGWYSGLGVFGYITLRSVLAALTGLVLSLVLGPLVIRRLRISSVAQPVRNDGPRSHFSKIGTPTLGGVPILLALLISTLLWADLANAYVWVVMGSTVCFGVIGFADDYRKLAMRTSAGLPSWLKFVLQSVAAVLVLALLSQVGEPRDSVLIPYFKDLYLPLGILFPAFAFIVIVGSSNAVNLTDGLDGLAIMPIAIAAAALGLFFLDSRKRHLFRLPRRSLRSGGRGTDGHLRRHGGVRDWVFSGSTVTPPRSSWATSEPLPWAPRWARWP